MLQLYRSTPFPIQFSPLLFLRLSQALVGLSGDMIGKAGILCIRSLTPAFVVQKEDLAFDFGEMGKSFVQTAEQVGPGCGEPLCLRVFF
jgi:hypothetical protein